MNRTVIENPHIQIVNKMRSAMSDSEKKAFNEALIEEALDLIKKGDQMMDAEAAEIKKRLGDIPSIISLSYIAEHYFGKSRTWLYQRINNNIVNGKPAYFTRSERKQLEDALHDISEKLSAVTLL